MLSGSVPRLVIIIDAHPWIDFREPRILCCIPLDEDRQVAPARKTVHAHLHRHARMIASFLLDSVQDVIHVRIFGILIPLTLGPNSEGVSGFRPAKMKVKLADCSS